jgi:hypothetical protein
VARRTESECFAVGWDRIFQILHPPQLLKASTKSTGEVVEENGTIWVARGTESECFAVGYDHGFQILLPAQMN